MNLKTVLFSAMWVLLVLGLPACETGTNQESGDLDDSPTGTIELALTAQGSSGATYILRNANFVVQPSYLYYDGYEQSAVLLDTEDDPYAVYLSARVIAGQYQVTLLGDWYIEKDEGGGLANTKVNAFLLSQATQWTWVDEGNTRRVVFRFGVGDDILDFVGGDIQIGIDIEEADAGAGGPDASAPVDGGWWD